MPLVLTQEIKDMVNNALTNGNPMALAVVTPDNKPVLSFRGSTQVYSDSALAIWMRAGSGTTLAAVKNNPHVALIYRSATTPLLQFQGRARIATGEAERNAIFEKAPQAEQNYDSGRTEKGPEFVKLER
jgi:hypothetical protein